MYNFITKEYNNETEKGGEGRGRGDGTNSLLTLTSKRDTSKEVCRHTSIWEVRYHGAEG